MSTTADKATLSVPNAVMSTSSNLQSVVQAQVTTVCIADDGALNKLTTPNLNTALHSRVQDGDQHWLIMQGLTGCLSRSMAVLDIQACWLRVDAQIFRAPATDFDSRVRNEMRELALLMRTPLPLDMSAEALADVETARANAQQGTNTFANQLPRHSRGRDILQNFDDAKANLKVAHALQKDIEGLQDRAEKLSLPDDSPVALRTSLHQWFQDLDALTVVVMIFPSTRPLPR